MKWRIEFCSSLLGVICDPAGSTALKQITRVVASPCQQRDGAEVVARPAKAVGPQNFNQDHDLMPEPLSRWASHATMHDHTPQRMITHHNA